MKKSYYCEKLEKTLHFLPDEIKFCCSCTEGLGVKIDDFSKINKNLILKAQKKYVQQLKNGIIPPQCAGCNEIKEQEVQKENLFEKFFKNKSHNWVSNIIVNHYKQCDCNCVYCSQKMLYPGITQNYELLPIIKQLYKQNVVSSRDLIVEFQGGNISLLKEFDDLIEEFKSNGCVIYNIFMNGINYVSSLEKIIEDKCSICLSLDAGTRETFKKIKNVDAFEQTIDNIKKLTQNQKVKMIIKYILLSGYNDTKEEIQNFVEVISKIDNIHVVVFEIDYREMFMCGNKDTSWIEKYSTLLEYAKSYCSEKSVNYAINDITKSFLK